MGVDDVNGDFHFAKRKLTGTWVNSPIFLQIWKAIRTEGLWANHDWTVKVDADSVFLPMRLRTKLSSQKVTSSGIYLEDCTKALNWKGQEKETGMEAWGEDLFMQRCMDLHGVDKVGVWDLTTDSMCAAFRPAGQKKNEVEAQLCIDIDGSNAPF